MRRFDLSRATSLALLLGLAGCSLVIDSSKYVGEGVDGGTNDGAPPDAPLADGELPDGGPPVELAPGGSVALNDYTPMAGDRVPVLLGPNTLGVMPTLEWKRGASGEWETLAGMELVVPVDASPGSLLFVRATWTPPVGEPLVREAGPAEVIERRPTWRPVLPDVGRETASFWDPINQRWIFVSERSGSSWWELAIPDGGLPRLVPLATPAALPRLNEGYGFVAVPDVPRQRMLFIGANTGPAQVFSMSLARSGPVTIAPLAAAGSAPNWRRVVGVTWVPAASGTGGSVWVCGGFFDGEPPVVTDECSSLTIAEGGGVTWSAERNLPRPLGGVTLFAMNGNVYGFGGLSFDTGATDGLIRLDDEAWSDVTIATGPTDARAAAAVAVLGSRAYLVGGATLTTSTTPGRAPGRVVIDFSSEPPTTTRDGDGLPGGVGGAAGFVGTTLYTFDGFEPDDSGSFDPGSFRRIRGDGPVEGFFVFDEDTPPPLVSALAGWTREGSIVYGGQRVVNGEPIEGAWTFEGGVQRAVMLEGTGPGPRAEVVVDTRAMGGLDPSSSGFPWTIFGGGGDESERAFWIYDGRWASQTFISGGPSPAARGAMMARTQGCGGASTFLVGGRSTTDVYDSFEAWGCSGMTCSWTPGLTSPGPVTYGTLTWDGDRTLVLLGGLANDPMPPGYARLIDHCLAGDPTWRDIELSAIERREVQRYGHTTTLLGFGNEAVYVMVGGIGLDGAPIGDVVAMQLSGIGMSTATGEFAPLPSGPPARAFHTALRSREGDRLWIVGGEGRDGQILGDVWELRRP